MCWEFNLLTRVTGLYEDLNLRIPAGTSSHTEMTLSGRGIEYMDSSNQYGDHIVHITIKMPTRLTEEQRALIREFARTERDTPGTVNGLDEDSGWRSWRGGGRTKKGPQEKYTFLPRYLLCICSRTECFY